MARQEYPQAKAYMSISHDDNECYEYISRFFYWAGRHCLPGGGDFVKETDSYCFKDYEKIVLIAPPKNN